MTKKRFLGEFEQMVLAGILQLENRAYGAMLLEEISRRTGRRVPSGSLYITLDRLEEKGYIRSRMADPEPNRGGRPKRFVHVTPRGIAAVRETRAALLDLWSGLEGILERQ